MMRTAPITLWFLWVAVVLASARGSAYAQAPRFSKLPAGTTAVDGYERGTLLLRGTLDGGPSGVFLSDLRQNTRISTQSPASPSGVDPAWPGGALDVRLEPGGLVGAGAQGNDSAAFTMGPGGWTLQATGSTCCSNYVSYPFSRVAPAAWGTGGLLLRATDEATGLEGLYPAGASEPLLEVGTPLPSGALVDSIIAVKAIPSGEVIAVRTAARTDEVYFHRGGRLEHVVTWPMVGGPPGSDSGQIGKIDSTGSLTILQINYGNPAPGLYAVSSAGVRRVVETGTAFGVNTGVLVAGVDGTTIVFSLVQSSAGSLSSVAYVARADGSVSPLLAPGTPLDGKICAWAELGPTDTFSEGRVVASVRFTDGTSDAYLLDVPGAVVTQVPAAGGPWLAALALGLSLLALHAWRSRTRA